ncbi:MAG: hypothetical protein WAP51_00600 [Candidatus Sungiibacteriota bacterium]
MVKWFDLSDKPIASELTMDAEIILTQTLAKIGIMERNPCDFYRDSSNYHCG